MFHYQTWTSMYLRPKNKSTLILQDMTYGFYHKHNFVRYILYDVLKASALMSVDYLKHSPVE